jgi:hypothetical protein
VTLIFKTKKIKIAKMIFLSKILEVFRLHVLCAGGSLVLLHS